VVGVAAAFEADAAVVFAADAVFANVAVDYDVVAAGFAAPIARAFAPDAAIPSAVAAFVLLLLLLLLLLLI